MKKHALGSDAIAMMESYLTPQEVEEANRMAASKLTEMRLKKDTARTRRTR
jgi:hypothetical protein